VTWSANVSRARRFLAENLLTTNSMSIALEHLWNSSYGDQLLVNLPLEGGGTPAFLEDFKNEQYKQADATAENFRQKWHPATLRLFLSPPEDPYLDALASQSNLLFRAVRVQMTKQVRYVFERSLERVATFFERYSPLSDEEFERATQGKNEVAYMPPLKIRIILQGNKMHVRMQPSLDDFESALFSMLDHCVSAVDGIPVIQPMNLKSYSPFALPDKAEVPEKPGSDEAISADAASLSKALYTDPGMRLKVAKTDEFICGITQAKIHDILQSNIQGPRKMVERYEQFAAQMSPVPGVSILSLNQEAFGKEYRAAKHSLAEYRADVDQFRKAAAEVMELSSRECLMGLFAVMTENVAKEIAAKCLGFADMLLKQILDDNNDEMNEIIAQYSRILDESTTRPRNAADVKRLKGFLEDQVPKELRELKGKTQAMTERMDFLFDMCKEIGSEDYDNSTDVYKWPTKLRPIVDKALEDILIQEEKKEEELKARQARFEENVNAAVKEIQSYNDCGDAKKIGSYLQQVVALQKLLQELEHELKLINEQEEIFGWNPTVKPEIAKGMVDCEPFEAFFRAVYDAQNNLHNWYEGAMVDLDPEQVEGEVDTMFRAAFKFCKTYNENKELLLLANSMKQTVADFKPHVPLIMTLCNKGMRDRHWDQMAEVVDSSIRPGDKTSLTDMIDRNLKAHLPSLEEISESASKEYSLEKNLNKQAEEWTETIFLMNPYRDSGTSILSGSCVDEIQMILDDQIVKTQTMLTSPYIKPFAERAKDWETFLTTTQDVIDIWLKVQAQWLYLEPIFASDDIKKQMPVESEKFGAVDKVFKNTVSKCLENPKVLVFTRKEGLLNDLSMAFDDLEIINKGLNAYLEQKRLNFSRFFFLSNDELLEILSETKDPTRVQPHLKKCFEAIAKLKFDEQQIIHGMISSESELVPWPRTLDPALARGAVEKWLVETETLMRESLIDQTLRAHAAYIEVPRNKWVLEWPGSVAIVIGQMYWTSEVEVAVESGGTQGVRTYAEKCTSQLDELIDLVRGNLTKLQRGSIGAMVVLDVHARDMTANLADEGMHNALDFSWLAQLRYYMEEDRVACKMITACLMYGYEYLGVSSRLVVTPLTDRAYRTLMGALQMKLGGAPEGPAGTGKTETTKDLAKAIANYCVVFNCSDGLDFLAMGKFFKGVVSCGAWACFDEFNRIDLEVLSVVAQQIMNIQRAVTLGMSSFDFEGSHLRVVDTCAVFITMNPGYAGRSDLPDNLKVLFRTVAMMVPDYGMIGEIILMSFGFSDARVLARKIVATYKLCSEQLSSQTHYDYGMRAVMAVLRAAGNLKQAIKDSPEDVLMLRAIRDVNAPKFLSHDVPLFEGICKDLFPTTVLPTPDYVNMLAALTSSCEDANLQPTAYFCQKTIELYEMIVVRHGLMAVGLSYGAKTCSYRSLAAALGKLKALDQNDENKVRIYTMNPKSITMGQLYGQVLTTYILTISWAVGPILIFVTPDRTTP
jgi:dynein heavy chain